MDEDVSIGVQLTTDYTKWKETAAKVPGLSKTQLEAINKWIDAANSALNVKDWDVFSKNFNKASSSVQKIIAATGNISEALQNAIKTKEQIEKTLNESKDQSSKIRSKYTKDMSGFNNEGARATFEEWKNKTGRSVRSDNNQELGRDETLKRFSELKKIITNLSTVTDAMAKNAHFNSREDVWNANKYYKYENDTKAADTKEVAKLDQTVTDKEQELADINEEIERLKPASEASAAALEELYKQIVNLAGAVNNDVTETKKTEREKKGLDSGAALDIKPGASVQDITPKPSAITKALKAFTAYTLVIKGLRKAITEAKKTVEKLDRALTEQAMVTGLTRKQTYGLLQDYQSMASRLGSTTKEVSSTMTQFLRQGRSINESLKLTEAAVSAAKVAGISAADSINYLTTAINGFQLSASDAMKVSDKFAAVAASAATSYEEVAIALSKVASQANLAGMSIDYTTALLTKGIETTREAPETIGTALKTIIARMRELGDYGETLEGDTDLNNVETQLGYIGIALRNDAGELRSTEDVLDDLGAKWDTLNANQQAAVAKALAGTRQQSRLIAMMSDYERVTELQEISMRSEGATMAQMATYMEGLDAKLNKISVAWESIVSAITDSEVIIALFDAAGNVLEHLGEFLDNTAGLVTAMGVLAAIGLNILGRKMMENELAKEQLRYSLQQQKNELEQNKTAALLYKATQKESTEKLKQAVIDQRALVIAKQKLVTTLKEKLANGENVKDQLDEEQSALNEAQSKLTSYETELAKAEAADYTLATYDKQNKLLESQGGLLDKLTSGASMMLTPLKKVWDVYKGMATAINKVTYAKKAEDAQTKKNIGTETVEAGVTSATSAAEIPFAGWIIAAAILAIVGVAAGVAIAALTSKMNDSPASKAADDINKLSKEIYDLNKKATAINTAIEKFEALDNRIIKTTEDLTKMKEIMEGAADNLSDEEKQAYEQLDTTGQYHMLKDVQKRTEEELQQVRNQQKEDILGMRTSGGNTWRDFLTNTKDSKIIQARASIYTQNNNELAKSIERFKKDNKVDVNTTLDLEKFLQSVMGELGVEKAADILANPYIIDNYLNAIAGAGDAASILQSEDYSIIERTRAFEKIYGFIDDLNDPEFTQAFVNANKGWDTLSKMSEDTLLYIDKIGANASSFSDFGDYVQFLGYTSAEAADMMDQLFSILEQGVDYSTAFEMIFGDDAQQMLKDFDKTFGTTILNMGQNMDKFNNQIGNFYEKAGKWNEMTESEKADFINQNSELFKGPEGTELLKAFKTGNYAEIEDALRNNEVLAKNREQILKDVNRQLDIELAKSAEERNDAYIQELLEYKRQLEDTDTLFLASLEMRYEQQQKQLELYRNMLQEEANALTDSLNKRKEAYQKYFEAVNKEAETEDYEEQVQTLIANISKLSSSTNADAMAKTADLTKQFEDLEKERLKELRQQAQDAVIENIDNEISKISDNLDKLLDNEQQLLNVMMQDIENPESFISSLMAAEFAKGNNTLLGGQTFLADLQSTYGSILPGVDWSQIELKQSGDSLVLNIMGKEIVLSDTDQQTIYEMLMQALTEIGLR